MLDFISWKKSLYFYWKNSQVKAVLYYYYLSGFHFHGNRIKIAFGGQKQTENTSLDLVKSLLEVIYIDRVLWEDLHNLMGQSFSCQKPKEDSVVNDHVQKKIYPFH